MASRPRVIVFDLDGTLWDPEMYQLHGGAPFKVDPSKPTVAVDRSGTRVQLLGETRDILAKIAFEWNEETDADGNRLPKTYLGISSTCDYPSWAEELLKKFTVPHKSASAAVPMGSVFHSSHIYYANKAQHMRKILASLHEVDPSISEPSQLLFFDNQMNNIRDVSGAGVVSCYTPRGMQPGVFEKGLEQWRKEAASALSSA